MKKLLLSTLLFVPGLLFGQGNIKSYNDQSVFKWGGKEVSYYKSGITLRTQNQKGQVVVTAIKGNKGVDILVLDHGPEYMNSTILDLNNDGIKEILLVYNNADSSRTVEVRASSDYKVLSSIIVREQLQIRGNKIYEYRFHKDYLDLFVYALVDGKLKSIR